MNQFDGGSANPAHPLAGLVEALGELIQTYAMRQAANAGTILRRSR